MPFKCITGNIINFATYIIIRLIPFISANLNIAFTYKKLLALTTLFNNLFPFIIIITSLKIPWLYKKQ